MIYHHAVPFSPSSSLLHECYNPEILQGVKVVKGLQATWGKCFRTIPLDIYYPPLACWKDIIACPESQNIVILDAITGISKSILSEHTGSVECLAFSLDGTLLVSGSSDKTVKLWDIQTGGVVKTFCGHMDSVSSTSISSDYTTIASGPHDNTIHLWNFQTGECYHVIDGHSGTVHFVMFSPTNSQLLMSASNDWTVWQWDINGHQIGPSHRGSGVTISPDGNYFVSWKLFEKVATL